MFFCQYVSSMYNLLIFTQVIMSGLSQATAFYIVILIVFATLGTPVPLTANK